MPFFVLLSFIIYFAAILNYMEQIFNIIIWAAIIQGLLLGLLFISSKEHNSLSNKLLGFFLLSLLMEAINNFLLLDSIMGYPIGQYFALPETKILFPIFFVHYVLEKLGRSKAYSSYLRINYAIAGLMVLVTLVNIGIFLFIGKSIGDIISFRSLENVFLIQQSYGFLLSAAGIIIAFREMRFYKIHVLNEFSDLDMLSISWLWRFVLLLVPSTLLWGAELTRIYISFYRGQFPNWDFVEITWGILTIFIYVISYQAFRRNDLFEGVEESNIESLISSIPIDKEVRQDDELEGPLTKTMEEDKLFLQKDLTIFDVAKHIGASTKKVSVCINNCFGSNFSEWVNKYRVEEAKLRIDHSDNNYLTIEAIGQDSGFKSRSAMYTAFKKFTGESPAKLRQATFS